jgi:penicillin-binding protein 1A
MQRYAEEAMKEYLTELQKSFNEHWKGREPWGPHKEILTEGMKRSDRYITLKQGGATEKEIQKSFTTKTKMQIFTWKGPKDTVLSPMDSIKFHKKILQAGFMSIDPQTGAIRAWVGGNDFRFFKYDHVKVGKRQVGSTIKPFLYTVAINEGYSPCYKVPNVKVSIPLPTGEVWSPDNSDGKYGGMMSLKEGLAESVNTVSAFLMKAFGPEAMVSMAKAMGIASDLPPYPSICLGTPDVSVLEMVGAYATYANKGVWNEPIYLTRIEDKNGNVLQEFVSKNQEAMSEQTAFVMLNMMKGVVEYGTSVRLRYKYGLTQPIAGKTGTTQNQSDGWFMGITPELVSGCWVGCEDRSVHFRTTHLGQGANTALPIWALYMKKIYNDKSIKISQSDFSKPALPLTIELDCGKYLQPGQQDADKDNF